jgi:hypothetical protein
MARLLREVGRVSIWLQEAGHIRRSDPARGLSVLETEGGGMSWLDLLIELIPPVFCLVVVLPLLIWSYINADMIVEWMVNL